MSFWIGKLWTGLVSCARERKVGDVLIALPARHIVQKAAGHPTARILSTKLNEGPVPFWSWAGCGKWDWWGLYLVQVILYGIHGMNVGWDPSQFLIPWTSWILHGMRMQRSWNDQFHTDSTWIPWNNPYGFMEQIQFHGNSTGIPGKQPYLIKNSDNIENWKPASMEYHVIDQMSAPSTALCNHSKIRR